MLSALVITQYSEAMTSNRVIFNVLQYLSPGKLAINEHQKCTITALRFDISRVLYDQFVLISIVYEKV